MKLIIFDFDGVLVDTLGISYSLNQEVNPNLSMEEYRSFFNGNIDSAVRSDGTLVNYRPDYNDVYSDKIRELKIPEALKTALRNFHSKYTLAIVSSTTTSSIKNVLESEGVDSYFKSILGRDVHRSKVIKIGALLLKYNVMPKDTVYVTDTVGDILEARECEVRSIAVTWGFHEEDTLRAAKPAKIVSNPEELVKAIGEVLK